MSSRKLPINIASMGKAKVKEWFDSFEYVITDCDGVIWMFMKIIGKAPEVINKFVENGKKVYIYTNDTNRTREQFVEKCKILNFNIGIDNIIAPAYISALYLKDLNITKKVYVIGMPAIGKELDAVGIKHFGIGPDIMTDPAAKYLTETIEIDPDVEAVLVSFDDQFSFPKLVKSTTYVCRYAKTFIATSEETTFPLPKVVAPLIGGMLSSVEVSTGRKAEIIGKPSTLASKYFFKDAAKKTPKKFLMIGDTLHTDILFGKRQNFQTLLVESGLHKVGDVQKIIDTLEAGPVDQLLENQIPDYYIKSLGDLLEYFDDCPNVSKI